MKYETLSQDEGQASEQVEHQVDPLTLDPQPETPNTKHQTLNQVTAIDGQEQLRVQLDANEGKAEEKTAALEKDLEAQRLVQVRL